MVRRVRLHWKARQESAPQKSSRLRLTISSSMSANAILRRYPMAEAFFNRLQIDRQSDGYESVEELAWRHGMNVAEVIEQLRQLAAFPRSEHDRLDRGS